MTNLRTSPHLTPFEMFTVFSWRVLIPASRKAGDNVTLYKYFDPARKGDKNKGWYREEFDMVSCYAARSVMGDLPN